MVLIDKQRTATSNGCLSKAWYIDKDDMFLVKGNMLYKSGYSGYEPYVEVIASIVADALGIPHIEYWLEPATKFPDVKTYNCKHVSVCVCKGYMIPEDVQKLSAAEYLYAFYGKEINANYWAAIINTYVDKKALCDMLVFDAIIGNNDRHLNNWEYLISSRGTWQMPLFDNGSSLLTFEEELPHSIHKIGRDLSKPFARTHFEQVSLIKRYFPQYRFVCDKAQVWGIIDKRVKSILSYIPDRRANLMYDYLYKRFNFYIDYVNGGD